MSKRRYMPNPNVAGIVAAPKPALSVVDAIALIVGVVIGAGILATKVFVAAVSGSKQIALAFWLVGGGMSLVGALCYYFELTTADPHAGGNYHYFIRVFGKNIAFLFAWARMAVIQSHNFHRSAYQLRAMTSCGYLLYSSLAYTGVGAILMQQWC